MKTTLREILSLISLIVLSLAAIAICVCTCYGIKQAIVEARQPKIYQIDTTQVNVEILHENAWGKIILVKEEDL